MRRRDSLQRLRFIWRVVRHFGLDLWLHQAPWLPTGMRLLLYVLWPPLGRRPLPTEAVEKRLRLALEELGPVFIKFGQFISTRPDLLPESLISELARLRDRVPPFPAVEARKAIEEALHKPIEQAFATFSDAPLASASIAQVHAATLADGRAVVAKVLRPGIAAQIEQDMGLLRVFARLCERYWPSSARFCPSAVVAEHHKNLRNELDMLYEAANASLLGRHFEHSELLRIPAVIWSHSSHNVLVSERIEGIAVDDIAALDDAGIDRRLLAERGVEIFFSQVFRNNFFHADMHPGNIFVLRDKPQNPQYIAVDFGIVGCLSPADKRYLAATLRAFFRRDYRQVARLHLPLIHQEEQLVALEEAVRAVCEPLFERPLKDWSMGILLLNLFRIARRFQIRLRPQLILLEKTLISVEGLGRQLYPDLDLWRTARPILKRWMRLQYSPRRALRQWQEQLPLWGEWLPTMAEEWLRRQQEGGVSSPPSDSGHNGQRLRSSVLAAALIVAAALLYPLDKVAMMAALVAAAVLLLLGRRR